MDFHSQSGCWALLASPVEPDEDDDEDEGGEREGCAYEDQGTDADDEDAPSTYFDDSDDATDLDGVDGGDDE